MTQTRLDPENWDDFREQAHRLLDQCIDRLAQAEDHPWQPVPDDLPDRYRITAQGQTARDITNRLMGDVLPHHTGNTHPRFFGWVHGTGLASGLLSEMVAATMNANCGGRDHGAIYMERAVIDWTRSVMGMPESASGILVTGTSQATVIALSAARLRALGPNVRATGNGATRLTAYAGGGVHNATRKAIELLGLGHENLHLIPADHTGVDVDAMRAQIEADRTNGATPFAIIATAGSVDTGRFDDLNALADLARDMGLWLHVDGAFGAWTRLADDPWHGLSDGIGRADSIALDFHKWMYVPYECGLVLIRDEAEHRAAFAARPSYLAPQTSGIGGGDPWFCDYGIDLSRGNRALKVWTALEHYGADALGGAITENCRLTRLMGDLIDAHPDLQLMAPVISNLCVFSACPDLPADAQSQRNTEIAQHLQNTGEAVLSTTIIDGVTCLRAAITNHRTIEADIHHTLDAVLRAKDM